MEKLKMSPVEKGPIITEILLPLLQVYDELGQQMDNYRTYRDYMQIAKTKEKETKDNFFVLSNKLSVSNAEVTKQINELHMIIETLLASLDVPEVTDILKNNRII